MVVGVEVLPATGGWSFWVPKEASYVSYIECEEGGLVEGEYKGEAQNFMLLVSRLAEMRCLGIT